MSDKNSLIEADLVDTLHNIENHLRFINDYFAEKQNESDHDPRIWHGLCKTLDMSIDNGIRYEIERQPQN